MNIQKIINEASKWIGYLEKKSNKKLESFAENAGNKNYTVFAKEYKDYFGEDYQGQPWCAMFVSVIFYKVFKRDDVMPHFAYCPTGVNKFKKMNAWYHEPMVGDVIFFTNGKRAYHTGIVADVDKTHVYTVEGNTENTKEVVENGGCVAYKCYKRNNYKILGYGRPNYNLVKENGVMEDKFLDCVGHYAEKHIEALKKCGIINGRDDGMFHPNEDITRAEAAMMVANALQYAGIIKL